MNTLSSIITTYTVSSFLNEVFTDPNTITRLQEFSEDCEVLGGNKDLFVAMANRELEACRLLEQEGGVANSMGGAFSTTEALPRENQPGNIAGYDPPIATGKKIFRRKPPNKYYTDRNNSY